MAQQNAAVGWMTSSIPLTLFSALQHACAFRANTGTWWNALVTLR